MSALKLVKNHVVGLGHDGGQDVEPAAMGHADNDVLDAKRPATLDDLLHGRYGGLSAVQAEALGSGKSLGQKALEALGLDELLEDGDLAFLCEGDLLVGAFDAPLQPRLLSRIADVHVLHPDRAAVRALQDREDFADGRGLETEHIVEKDRSVEVGLRKAVAGGIELGRIAVGDGQPERIKIGLEVTAHPVGADHHDRAQGIEGAGPNLIGAGGRSRRLDARFQLGFNRWPLTVDG